MDQFLQSQHLEPQNVFSINFIPNVHSIDMPILTSTLNIAVRIFKVITFRFSIIINSHLLLQALLFYYNY